MEAVEAGQRQMCTNDKGLRTPTRGEVHPTHSLSLGVRPLEGLPHTEPTSGLLLTWELSVLCPTQC